MPKIDIDMLLSYGEFVEERHAIWEARESGAPGPWTDNAILGTHKFTNVFRILDPGTQFVVTELARDSDPSPSDYLMRCLLYRVTNEIPAWEYMRSRLGRYPLEEDLPYITPLLQDYRDKEKGRVFNPAYLVYPGKVKGADKIQSVVDRVWEFMCDPRALTVTKSGLAQQVELLRSHDGIGDFVAMQVSTDYNYHPQYGSDSENRYILAGPGAKAGAKYIFPDRSPEDAIHWLRDIYWQGQISAQNRRVPRLGKRKMSLMDIQNTLCEFSKYVRYLKRGGWQQPYQPSRPGRHPKPVLPKHWSV